MWQPTGADKERQLSSSCFTVVGIQLNGALLPPSALEGDANHLNPFNRKMSMGALNDLKLISGVGPGKELTKYYGGVFKSQQKVMQLHEHKCSCHEVSKSLVEVAFCFNTPIYLNCLSVI